MRRVIQTIGIVASIYGVIGMFIQDTFFGMPMSVEASSSALIFGCVALFIGFMKVPQQQRMNSFPEYSTREAVSVEEHKPRTRKKKDTLSI